MQTLRLPAVVLRDLRAISPGFHPGRRPTPSQRTAAIWKGAQPLPDHPRPTSAVGLLSTAGRGGMKGLPGLSNSPVPTSAVGSRPAGSCPQPDRGPAVRAGLLQAAPLRKRPGAGPHGAGAMPQVCRWQTARAVVRKPPPCAVQVPDTPQGQARLSATLRAASDTLPSVRRPQRCGARSGGQTTRHPGIRHSTDSGAPIALRHVHHPAAAG